VKYGAQSECGRLRTLLLHRPKPADLKWIRADTLSYYNFRAAVDPEKFLAEFDGMVQAFAQRGVEIVFLADVLKGNSGALAYISRRPNLLYMRDMAMITDVGAVVMNPYIKGRRGDEWVVAECFRRLGIPILAEIRHPGYLEGGGAGLLREKTGYVSLCDRATDDAISQFAAGVLGRALERLLVVELPEGHVHIDGLFMVIDDQMAFAHRPVLEIAPTRVLHATGKVERVWFLDYLGDMGYEIIDGPAGMEMNYVAFEPGRVIGYDFCAVNSRVIAARDGEVVGISGAELVKGNGGVHCMTCPLWREGVR
jgi:arginine deiminase